MRARGMNLVRAGLGVAHLAAPGLGGRLLSGATFGGGTRAVVRVLGARQLLQAAATWVGPTPAVLALGAEVDMAHSASMIALAGFNRRLRRAGLFDAAMAGALACAGLIAAGSAPGSTSGPVSGAWVWALRDRLASALAGPLVPSWLPGGSRDPG